MARSAVAPDSISARLLHPTSSSALKRYWYRTCSLSMNGCKAAPERALGLCETRTLPAVSAPETALSELQAAVFSLKAEPPPCSPSGIIRLEIQVPIRKKANAIDWLHAQSHLPRCFFSGRGQRMDPSFSLVNGGGVWSNSGRDLVGVAGVGSAVFFQGIDPFAFQDWKCIRRFLSKDCPLIRAYGAIRFDARANISSEWKDFGSFYFTVPQVEFDELEESSILATTIAWDDSLLWTWKNAVDGLQVTMHQISPYFHKSTTEVPQTTIISWNHVPTKASWNTSVKKALQIIRSRDSELVKVVLARCSTYVTDTCIDPVTLLSCLQVEGENAYQFYIQPPDAPAFIGNTPEQLFHRKYLNISSEALAGTRARSLNKDEDLQIGRELLFSPKDHIEFTIVRESIRRKLESICDEVLVEPSKALRKLPRVQHLCAQLSGRLMSEDDEFAILASLHPSPAVCGLPMEEARQFIKNNEMFDRGMYAGPVGWFGGRESEFAVGIRSALVGKGFSTLIYAGAGIVEGTNPCSEWDELDLKASQFTKLLQQWEHQTRYREINIGSAQRGGY
ncbi:isochorismate synthase 2, chloroplastic isoform X2 [Dioscorea cayenensis subsp. rotundata]|uniref:isochorismate synthase n=1 Tax=Dioscorea cayennensis subsp. rotundata TaxID=55577 RepID=A0AB40AU45_DIOCR|nr:isochorismate synthase 2, chloroplastic isoform X2 [Dioscorea cayenensis subsp. rotundata]